jgi:hypothetical protein
LLIVTPLLLKRFLLLVSLIDWADKFALLGIDYIAMTDLRAAALGLFMKSSIAFSAFSSSFNTVN